MKTLLIIGYILLAMESVILVLLIYSNAQLKRDDRLQTELYKATDAQLMWEQIKNHEPLDY